MTRDEAKNQLLEIMEVADDVHGDCNRCPFYNIIDYGAGACPFGTCPECGKSEQETNENRIN